MKVRDLLDLLEAVDLNLEVGIAVGTEVWEADYLLSDAFGEPFILVTGEKKL